MSQIFDRQPRAAGVSADLLQPGEPSSHRAAVVETSAPIGGREDDAALLERYCRMRCGDAFEAIVARHAGWVSRLVRRHVKDLHLAEDVTQAVFIVLARKAGTIPPGTPLSAWLFRVARYAANDSIKQESRRRQRMSQVAAIRTAQAGASGHVKADDAIGSELEEALACLSESDRQIILLRFYEDQSIDQLSVALGITPGAAKQRLSRAIRRLREMLVRRGAAAAVIAALLTQLRRGAVSSAAEIANIQAATGLARVAGGQAEASIGSLRIARATTRLLARARNRLMAAVGGAMVLLLVGMYSPVMGQVIVPLVEKIESALAPAVIVEKQPEPRAPDAQPSSQRPIVAQLWIGGANTYASPVLPLNGPMGTLPLRSFSGADVPVAVTVNLSGQYFAKRLETPLPRIQTPRDENDDYADLNPYGLLAGDAHFAELSDATQGWMDPAGSSDWQQVPQPDAGGVIVLPWANPGGLGPGGNAVPEPDTLMVVMLSVAAILLTNRTGRGSRLVVR